VSDLPVDLAPDLALTLAAAFDREGKIVRALDALGPVAGRDVLLLDTPDGEIRRSLAGLGARLVDGPATLPLKLDAPDGSMDAVLGLWSTFRGVDPESIAEADRVLRADGRLLVVQHYGRDDVSHVIDGTEAVAWGRPFGPFLSNGFRVRVLHCWWTFESLEAMIAFLGDAFGDRARTFASSLRRPRLAHKVAVYHRSRPAT
jgi:hypothetical protein